MENKIQLSNRKYGLDKWNQDQWDKFWRTAPGNDSIWPQRWVGKFYLEQLLNKKTEGERGNIIQRIDIDNPKKTLENFIDMQIAKYTNLSEVAGSFYSITNAMLGGKGTYWVNNSARKDMYMPKKEALITLSALEGQSPFDGKLFLPLLDYFGIGKEIKLGEDEYCSINNYSKVFDTAQYDIFIAANFGPGLQEDRLAEIAGKLLKPNCKENKFICWDGA